MDPETLALSIAMIREQADDDEHARAAVERLVQAISRSGDESDKGGEAE